jgi:hypothetical protein
MIDYAKDDWFVDLVANLLEIHSKKTMVLM